MSSTDISQDSTGSGRIWIEDGPTYYITPDGEVETVGLVDGSTYDKVDELRCVRCGTPLGWWVDADDDGRTIGGWIAYGVSGDRRRRWCEDCYPGGRP